MNLKDRCRIVTDVNDDSFVGIKADTDNALIYFPLGYQLPEKDSEIRKEILKLFGILNEFKDKKEGLLAQKNFNEINKVNFPLNAYLNIIYNYFEFGYYKEVDSIYKTESRGKINWSKTIKQQTPLISFNENKNLYSSIYTSFTVKDSTPNENKEITIIHQHCVYESFEKIGWIFTSYMPPKPKGTFNKNKFLFILKDRLRNTNNDNKKILFKSMINMINFMDENGSNKFYFGTRKFEHIFEGLIDKTFGIKNKDYYFPKANWKLNYNKDKSTYPLQPDTIMMHNNKIYIIDAKYYKYGITRNPNDLPGATSINKQITYGEYVKKLEKDTEIYNAFLMPYDKNNNLFESNEILLNIGESTSEWKENKYKYEHIQGILIDIKYLMKNYKLNSEGNISKLAELIEKSYKENNY